MASRIEVVEGKHYLIESGMHFDLFNPIRVFSRNSGKFKEMRWGSWTKISVATNSCPGPKDWKEVIVIN